MKKYILLICALSFASVSATVTKESNLRNYSENILKAKCMDCHSSQTFYPWYYNLPGAKALIDADVEAGRASLDFEEEVFNQAELPKAIAKRLSAVIKSDRMPPIQFKLAHWDKVITAEEKQMLLKWLDSVQGQAIQPLPSKASLKLNQAKVALGQSLYNDKRLSGDNTISCATCHDLAKGGTDRSPVSTGIHGAKGPVNSPTVYNSSYNVKQFWDGRAKDLIEQAAGPVMNPIEMGSKSWDEVIAKLKKDPTLIAKFQKAYGSTNITGAMITESIAEFEKSLVTPNSRFDKYLKGDKKVLTATEIKGYQLFEKYSCTTCHYGPAVGGGKFENFGKVKAYKGLQKSFKVPILRNVELTYPYFHDGSVKTLEEAVAIMGEYEVGVKIPTADNQAIVAFLKTLTDEDLKK